jgi:hypothetical protein
MYRFGVNSDSSRQSRHYAYFAVLF